jgi:hypothetical protein
VTVALLSVTVLVTSSAGAAENDSFAALTTDECGDANFIDYGPGAPGGGNNDDYVVIHDYCADGHGVQVCTSRWTTMATGTRSTTATAWPVPS